MNFKDSRYQKLILFNKLIVCLIEYKIGISIANITESMTLININLGKPSKQFIKIKKKMFEENFYQLNLVSILSILRSEC